MLSGSKTATIRKYKEQDDRGEPTHGPFLPKRPDMLLKRMIRGMLPRKTSRGRDALKRIKCYMGIPKEFEGKDMTVLEKAHVDKLPNFRYMSVGELSATLKK